MGSVTLSVDGQSVTVEDGAYVLDAVREAGGYVPQLCRHPDTKPIGACRTCLVKVEGVRGLPAACSLPVSPEMDVFTSGPELDRVRATILQLTTAMTQTGGHGRDGTSELREALDRTGTANHRFPQHLRTQTDVSNPFFQLTMADCILCGRCADACQDVQHIGALGIGGAGESARVTVFADGPIGDSICTSCGSCVTACPVGALWPKAGRSLVEDVTQSTCPYCGVGCGIEIHTKNDKILWVDGDFENRSSQGMLCVKGRFGTTFVRHQDRLTMPLVRKDGVLQEASWGEALDIAAEGLWKHRGAFGSFASAKATNEDAYVQQKFVRLVMGTNNIDHCTRLCHSPSVEAMLQQLGSGATSNSYEDYDNAGCLMVVGCDPSSNHPVISSRLRRAIESNGAKLIVINPKRIDLCDLATLWLRALPGTDVALLNGIAKAILDLGLADEQFVAERTEGFEEWRAGLDAYTPESVEQITSVRARDVVEAARLYARGGSPSPQPLSQGRGAHEPTAATQDSGPRTQHSAGSCLIWGMGITQHTNGTDNAHALLNMALVAGQMGRPGNGVSPLRGQNNVQGCGDAGCIPDNLPGYQGYRPAALAAFEDAWGSSLPHDPGTKATDMVEGMLEGHIRAMYIVGENPLLSEPNLEHASEAMRKLDFLVVQDIFMHETAEIADVVLPAAAFAEKDGTFTNSERRVQRVRPALPPIGESRGDWQIAAELGRRLAVRAGADPAQFEWPSSSAVWDEMARLMPIVQGISYARLDSEGGLQWPCPEPGHPGTLRLYTDSFPLGNAKFVPVQQSEPAQELPSRRFPYILNTGRILYHWHGGTITRRVPGLVERAPDVPLALNPKDAAELEVVDGEEVVVTSRRGEMTAIVRVTDAVAPGEVFVPFVRLKESAANFLTNNVYDDTSRIPEYKVCAIRIDKKDAPRARPGRDRSRMMRAD